SLAPRQDAIVKAAAVADYTPAEFSPEKIKKKDGDMAVPLRRTQDILKYLGEHKRPGQFLCGFSMETERLLENSREKLLRKNVDMIVANSLKTAGAGFGTDTNVVTLITPQETVQLPLMSKEEVAHQIWTSICTYWSKDI
ncbi:MAG: phosphopantothenoylcysteine decarboxylase, partial [Eubacteriales bacterium]|nr:phosphopantothenoylcysteine decarboxylase [Eubacteriales bacterium]